MVNIKFGKLEDFNKNPDAYVGIIPTGIASKKELLQSYADVFKFPGNFCDNWDYFDELLSDFSWLSNKHFVIYHEDVPNLGDKDVLILLKILNDISHSNPYTKDKDLIQTFIVAFPEQYKERIEKILEEIKNLDDYQLNQIYKQNRNEKSHKRG
ncbi:MAG: barstar family protein [Candidatus Staskawiczbacteria bacterium]|nr:barstar family protein [Candidatus Staskawiczbacteria bacterium]